MRALAEAAGSRVHVYTSPHLVRFNERFRIAGDLVSDVELAATLERIEQINAGAAITVFEVITAAALQLFATHPADLCLLEVGLGGRGDATNVVTPRACAITSISIDHRDLLGDTLEAIAGEKAGIIKAGVPVVTGAQDPAVLAVLQAAADRVGAKLAARSRAWEIEPAPGGLRFSDSAGSVDFPAPSLPGPHQIDNAGIAIAALRAAHAEFGPRWLGAGEMARAAAASDRSAGRAAEPRNRAVARWRTQPGCRPGARHGARAVARPAVASRRRDEANQGRRRVSAPVAAAGNHGLGRSRAGSARGLARRRHHRGIRVASRAPGRRWPRRWVRFHPIRPAC